MAGFANREARILGQIQSGAPVDSNKPLEKPKFNIDRQIRELDEAELSKFRSKVSENIDLVFGELERLGTEEAIQTANQMAQLPKDQLIPLVFETADALKIKNLKQGDPSFTRLSAFVRGAGDTALLGQGSKLVAGVADPTGGQEYQETLEADAERARLLATAFPGTTLAGQVAGFLSPTSVENLIFKGGSEAVQKLTSRVFAKELAQKGLGKVAASVAEVGAGVGAIGAARGFLGEGGEEAFDVGRGLERGAEFASFGGAFGGVFAAVGLGASKLRDFKPTGVLARGAKAIGGKEIAYQLDNVELIRNVVRETPEAFIAKATDDLLPQVQKVQQTLKGIETESKQRIIEGLKNQEIKLTGQFQDVAENLSKSVEELRQANLGEIAQKSKALNENIGQAFRKINTSYGEELNQVLQTRQNARVNMAPVRDVVEKILKENRSLNVNGTLRDGSEFAKNNPELFNQLATYWDDLGGPIKAQGGSGNITFLLQDAIELKKGLGSLANFGDKADRFSGTMRSLYNTVRVGTEKVAPELKTLNQTYMQNRSKVDRFRNVVGRNEEMIARKLRRNLLDNKDLLVREALEGFGELGGDIAKNVGEAFTLQERQKLLSTFKTQPKQVFNQLRQAYLNNDQITLRELQRTATKLPQLEPFLKAAQLQASQIQALPRPTSVSTARLQDPTARGQIVEAVPQLDVPVERARQSIQQQSELNKVLPQDRLALEQRLRDPELARSGIEKQVLDEFRQRAPASQDALGRAEAGRVADALKTGKGLEKRSIEELPIVGDLLFGLRKAATPAASKVIDLMVKGTPRVQKAVTSDVVERIKGTSSFSKASFDELASAVGARAAIIIYLQNGGQEDVLQAVEELSQQEEQR